MSDDDQVARHEALEAHRAAGWQFVTADASQDFRVVEPPELPQGPFSGQLKSQAQAFGLSPCLDACKLWRVSGCQPKGIVGMLMWRLMGTLSAARLCMAVLQSAAWASAVVRALLASLHGLQQAMASHKGAWLSKRGKLKQEVFTLFSTFRAALHSCRALSQGGAGRDASATLSAECVVCMCADLDLAYYALLEHHLSCGYDTPPVPPPHVYFPALAQAHPGLTEALRASVKRHLDAGNAAAVKALVRQCPGGHAKAALRKVWGVRKAAGGLELPEQTALGNPLLAVLWARFQESCRLFHASGLALAGGLDRVAAEEDARMTARVGSSAEQDRPSAQMKRRRVESSSSSESDASTQERSDSDGHSSSSDSDAADAWQEDSAPGSQNYAGAALAVWPADSALSRWRAASRECHVYAYAPPTREAVRALAAAGPLLEVGAGTGYWAAQLRQAGARVTAVESHPPGAGSGNLWHKGVPAMAEVGRGGVESVAAASPSHALLLCYPPSDSTVASQCLQAFRGSTVCFVGEWYGDTGDAAFMHQLQSGFRLKHRIALPNWSDTAHELTIWQRRSSGGRASVLPGTLPYTKRHLNGKSGPATAADSAAVVCSHCGRSEGCPEAQPASQGGTSTKQTKASARDDATSHARKRGRARKVIDQPLRRCCFCRQAVYCSAACLEADQARHDEMHALRMLFFKDRKLSFWSAVDFECLRN